jgi:predicted dehydrogenase
LLVATPPKYRKGILDLCMKYKIHVLAEKPIFTVPVEAEYYIKIMRNNNLHFGVVHNYKERDVFKKAKEIIKNGMIGRVKYINLQWLGMRINPSKYFKLNWRQNLEESGGGIFLDLIHFIYILEFLMDEKIQSVIANIELVDDNKLQIEDFGIVNYKLESCFATVSLWWGKGNNGFQISGDEGYMIFDQSKYEIEINGKNHQEKYLLNNDDFTSNTMPFIRVHESFIKSIRERKKFYSMASDNFENLNILMATYFSAFGNKIVKLPLSKNNPLYLKGFQGLNEIK